MKTVANTSVCTLYEKHFHFGVGALVNSLVSCGFKGRVFVGYRKPLPPWLPGGAESITVGSDVEVTFVELETEIHFTHYKPAWMKEVFERLDPECEALFYFDPDIAVLARWDFYKEWVSRGIALCADVNGIFPDDHPIRLQWAEFLNEHGYEIARRIDRYFNGGFLGLRRESKEFLDLWEDLTLKVEPEAGSLKGWRSLDRTYRFWSANQDTLNMAAMATGSPLSTIGPEGMDFIPGGVYMSHAVGSPKPWNKPYIRSALGGVPPTRAEKAYWQFADGPVKLYSKPELSWHRLRVKIASGIGRFISRS